MNKCTFTSLSTDMHTPHLLGIILHMDYVAINKSLQAPNSCTSIIYENVQRKCIRKAWGKSTGHYHAKHSTHSTHGFDQQNFNPSINKRKILVVMVCQYSYVLTQRVTKWANFPLTLTTPGLAESKDAPWLSAYVSIIKSIIPILCFRRPSMFIQSDIRNFWGT